MELKCLNTNWHRPAIKKCSFLIIFLCLHWCFLKNKSKWKVLFNYSVVSTYKKYILSLGTHVLCNFIERSTWSIKKKNISLNTYICLDNSFVVYMFNVFHTGYFSFIWFYSTFSIRVSNVDQNFLFQE